MNNYLFVRIRVLEICPTLPDAATAAVNEMSGYVLGGVAILFGLAIIIGIGAILVGRIFGIPHVTKAGVMTLVVTAIVAIALPVVYAIVMGLRGTGCIGVVPSAAPTPQ
ncbi:hypothetical protein [Propioniciclava soli]|uniref:hypothetical protein n=1 Tax=Propioniciclava soli TaxID=2775081 RepID=UPI001E648602|nr:hypothetical protein [Propioniciclava soli]